MKEIIAVSSYTPATATVENLPVVAHQGARVITTELLAAIYGTAQKNIHDNFSNNLDRFEPGKHFFRLEGEPLREFKENTNRGPENFRSVVGVHVRELILWTERGAARHAKMLNTDQAWEVFERLEDAYFKGAAKHDTPQIPPHTRFLATHDGTAWWLKEIPSSAFIMPAEDWPKVIKTDDFPRELLTSVLSAVSERMLAMPASTAFKSPGPYIDEDPDACLNHLLNATLRIDGKPPTTVRDLIRAGDSRALGRYGLRKTGTNFLISNNNSFFAGSRWDGVWRTALLKLPGAFKPKTVFKIGGRVNRCVCVQLSIE